jgi:cell division protein ZapA
MPIVTISLNNKNFQLSCNDGAEGQLLKLAGKLNDKILEIKASNPYASFELLLVMAALSIQDALQSASSKLAMPGEKKSEDEEKFAETLSTIAGYLEELARKLAK